MRILIMMLTLVLIAVWTPVTTAQAQPCEPSNCWGKNAKKAGSAKAAKKPAAVKKIRKSKEEYMKAAN